MDYEKDKIENISSSTPKQFFATDNSCWWDSTKLTPQISLAEQHVDWFLTILRPLLVSWFEHGYKHGRESYEKENKNKP